ncbi:MAG: hypothetical protein HQ539_02715 [Parcubacteria group bacterium]|nr:hypothetical protein [Parcubacteria group bacterium]
MLDAKQERFEKLSIQAYGFGNEVMAASFAEKAYSQEKQEGRVIDPVWVVPTIIKNPPEIRG